MNGMWARRALGAVLVAAVALPIALLTAGPAHATAHRAEISYRATVAIAIADIQHYWSGEFPTSTARATNRFPSAGSSPVVPA